MNLRDKILNADDIKTEEVTVQEWGVNVKVKGMTGKSRSNLLEVCVDKDGNMDFEKLYPLLLIGTVYDPESDEKVFEAADHDALNEKSGGALEKVAKVAMKLSGLDEGSAGKAEKN